MKISVFNRQKDLPIAIKSVRPIVKEVLAAESFTTDEVAIYFVTQQEICRLHEEFFQDPSPTDCITLPIDGCERSEEGFHMLGEVFICPKAALEYQTNDAYQETTLYLVHTILHLLGYDDIKPRARTKMRAAEKKHMETLSNKGLLLKK